jgi:regulator of replication initiation timing
LLQLLKTNRELEQRVDDLEQQLRAAQATVAQVTQRVDDELEQKAFLSVTADELQDELAHLREENRDLLSEISVLKQRHGSEISGFSREAGDGNLPLSSGSGSGSSTGMSRRSAIQLVTDMLQRVSVRMLSHTSARHFVWCFAHFFGVRAFPETRIAIELGQLDCRGYRDVLEQ